MSLVVTAFVPEGIIMAGDSRLTLTYSSKSDDKKTEFSHTITASDSNDKIFILRDRFVLGTFEAADIKGIPIAGFINRFIEEKIVAKTEIDEIPKLLAEFFGAPQEFPNVNFYAAGYKSEKGISTPQVYFVNIAGKTFNRVNTETNKFGANWGGETEVMTRLLSEAKVKQGEQTLELGPASIPFNFFTLQDAIDFAVYAIRTTIESLRFQIRPKTVGGSIDIAAMKPGEKPIWVSKKQYRGVESDQN